MSAMRKVAIIGRMNVGKSTLFNRLSTDVKSLTFDYPGVTRDFISDVVSWRGKAFELIDTGGIGLKKSTNLIEEEVRKRALLLLEKVDLILFVVDGKSGLTIDDQEIVKTIYNLKKPIILVVNKIDTTLAKERLHEFYALGIKSLYAVSASHAVGTSDLLDGILNLLKNLPEQLEEELQPLCRVVLLGKPNVGKSSILNSLLNYERSIVSDQPGTTREAISAPINFYKQTIELVDTAGVRRKRAVDQGLEQLMVKSTLDAVDNCDIVLLVVDASEGKVVDQELKLAFYAFERGKALIILLNKQDLTTDVISGDLLRSMDEYQFFLKKIDILQISCKTGKNMGKILPLVTQVWERYSQTIDDDELNQLLKSEIVEKPLYHKTKIVHLYRAYQVKSKPPTIALDVNEPDWVQVREKGFFENVLRKKYNFKSVPIVFVPRKRK